MRKSIIVFTNLCLLFTIILLSNCTQPKGDIQLPAIFTDHLVLQQNSKAAIWGTATPTVELTIKGTWGESQKVVANEKGEWRVDLPVPAAGGPYELQISTGDTIITIEDVMIGEVWLCSGQSNMEMPLKGWPPRDLIDNSAEEIRLANYPMIRMFTVTKIIEVAPVSDFSGNWSVCSPQSAGDFSATAYFFGKELYEKIQVPIGLIHTSWGGTPAESWIEGKHLSNLADYKDVLTKLEKAKPQQIALTEWFNGKKVVDNTRLPEETRWEKMDFKDAALIEGGIPTDWLTMELPQLWEEEKELASFDGIVLFKKEFTAPTNLTDQELILTLGAIDDMDETYLNGQLLGSSMGGGLWNKKRNYPIAKGMLKEGKNTLTVRVVDTGGGGGFSGAKEEMNIHATGNEKEAISLAGKWTYLPIADYKGGKFHLFGGTMAAYKSRPKVDLALDAHTPTVLYNGMIAPLIPYTVKGAIWYQGESNANRAKQYETLFPKMIESWRNEWGQGDFPFYFAQIAPFRYDDPEATPSAELRDAQRKSLSLPNTGMAVTMDIGNVNNIHPGNKQDVGKRLALWALAKDYEQKDLVFSGPLYKGMAIDEDKIRVTFDHIGQGLIVKEKQLKGFEIAGADGEFVEAVAVIDGDGIIVYNSDLKAPKHVRYAFKNGSLGTLFNAEELPASSFSTE